MLDWDVGVGSGVVGWEQCWVKGGGELLDVLWGCVEWSGVLLGWMRGGLGTKWGLGWGSVEVGWLVWRLGSVLKPWLCH